MDNSQEQVIWRDSYSWEIDPINRDPKKINEDVIKINFEDVIGEPAGVHSLDCLWKASYFTFTSSRSCCYRTLTAIFGIPLSLIWGLLFACLSFWHIWAVVPCIKSFMITFQCISQIYLYYLNFLFVPFFEALGKILSSVKVFIHKEV